MANTIVYPEEGVQEMWIGETVVFKVTYLNKFDSAPTAVGSAVLYDPTGSDVTSGQASGSASVASSVVTLPSMTPTSSGMYQWFVPITVGGNTIFGAVQVNVDPVP